MSDRVWSTWRQAEGGFYCLYSDGYYGSLALAAGSFGPFATEEQCFTALRGQRAEADARRQESLKAAPAPAAQSATAAPATARCAVCRTETPRLLLMTSPQGAVCPDCYDHAEEL